MIEARYKTHKNETTYPPVRFSVIDTQGKTLGERHMCACDTEEKANFIVNALNFNDNPYDYGYKLEVME